MKTEISLISGLLNRDMEDVLFLINLLEENNVELDIEEIQEYSDELGMDELIVFTYEKIIRKFFLENVEQIYSIMYDCENIDESEYDYFDLIEEFENMYEICIKWKNSFIKFHSLELEYIFRECGYQC